jgi:hypothetical protein
MRRLSGPILHTPLKQEQLSTAHVLIEGSRRQWQLPNCLCWSQAPTARLGCGNGLTGPLTTAGRTCK